MIAPIPLLADVPNLWSTYELYKRIYALTGKWVYGDERGVGKRELIRAGRELGMECVDTYRWSFRGYPYRHVFDLAYMLPLLLIRAGAQLFGRGHDSIGVILKKGDDRLG